MRSKWIEELDSISVWSPSWGEGWANMLPTLERIDKLLKRAMLDIENENLYEDIRKELEDGID